MMHIFSKEKSVIEAGTLFLRSCSYDYILVSIVFCLNGYLNGKQKTLWTMVSCSFGALVLRIPLVWYVGKFYSDNIKILGCVAPFVSGIMAVYTLIYVISEGKTARKRSFGSE